MQRPIEPRYADAGAASAVAAVGAAALMTLLACGAALLVARGARCSGSSDCPKDRAVCLLGRCVECGTSSDCLGRACDQPTNTCRACTAHADCPGGSGCAAGACVVGTPCGAATVCPPGVACTAGKCAAAAVGAAAIGAAACQVGDCDAGQFCDPASGTCRPGCQRDEDCPLASAPKCDRLTGHCGPCVFDPDHPTPGDPQGPCALHGVDSACITGRCTNPTNSGVSWPSRPGDARVALWAGVGTSAGVLAVCVVLGVWVAVVARRAAR